MDPVLHSWNFLKNVGRYMYIYFSFCYFLEKKMIATCMDSVHGIAFHYFLKPSKNVRIKTIAT